MRKLKLIFGSRAAKHLDALIISDTHFGIERDLERKGIRAPVSEQLAEEIIDLIKRTKSKKLFIVGDAKHSIGGDERAEQCLKMISETAEVHVIKGNHDGSLLGKNYKLHDSRGVAYGDVWMFHGHAYPNIEAEKKKYWIMGHLHPSKKIGSELEDVFIISNPDEKSLRGRKFKNLKGIKVVVLPSFNPILSKAVCERKDYKNIFKWNDVIMYNEKGMIL